MKNIWKLWKKGKLNSKKIVKILEERSVEYWNDLENMDKKTSWIEKRNGKCRINVGWIVKWYRKYGRKVSWKVKRYGKYWRNVGWIVKWYGKYGRKVSLMGKEMENMKVGQVE